MSDNYEDFGPNDISEKTFEVDNNVIRIRRTNPYGFCHISYERGNLPEHLKGSYTSYYEAEKAVMSYLESKESSKSPVAKEKTAS